MRRLTYNPLLLLTIAGFFVLVTMVTFHENVPLYDGVGFPDESYRYIVPPANTPKTAAPTVGQDTASVHNGTNDTGLSPATQEQGPQAVVDLPQHSLTIPRGTSTISITIQPQAPGSHITDGTTAGNSYHVITNPAKVSYTSTAGVSIITLRLPQGLPPGPTIEYKASGSTDWQALQTYQVGADIYEADFKGFGDYQLVMLSPTATIKHAQATTPKKKPPFLLIGLALFVGAVLTTIVWVRISSKKDRHHRAKR
jgi:hypothetical protein